MVDFVPFPGLASTDNNTIYQANSVVTTANSGTVIAATSMVIYPQTGFVGLGTTIPSQQLDVYTGNLKLGSTGQRILGDFTNATLTNRTSFQTTTTNGTSSLPVLPNGSGTQAGVILHNSSTPDNSGYLSAFASSSTTALSADKAGTGSYLPMGFYTSGTERMRISTAGNIWMSGTVGVGTSNSAAFGNNTSNLYVWGNVIIANTTVTGSGIFFPDGTRQTTAFSLAINGSFGPANTIQVAGPGNTFSGDGSQFVWDNTNKRLGIGTNTPAYLLSLYGNDYVLFNNRPGAAARQEITVGNVIGYGSVLGYDPSIGQSIGYLRRGDSAATSPAITWTYISSNYRVGINAITQPQNTMDIAGAVAIGTNYSGFNVMSNTNGLSVQGLVGIGTFTPFCPVDVYASSNGAGANPSHVMYRNALSSGAGQTTISWQFGGTIKATNRVDYNGGMIWNSGANAFYFNNEAIGGGTAGTVNFYAGSSNFMNVLSSSVLLGLSTAPANSSPLTINSATGAGVEFVNNNSGGGNISAISGGGLQFGTFTGAAGSETYNALLSLTKPGTNATGNLLMTGNINATLEVYAYFSDQRLKDNIVVIDNALDRVMAINGVFYNPNELAETLVGESRTSEKVGLLAQEVEAVMPQVIKAAPFDIMPDGTSRSGANYKTIQYEKLVPLLVQAIKEQQKKIDDLEARLTTLELDPWQ